MLQKCYETVAILPKIVTLSTRFANKAKRRSVITEIILIIDSFVGSPPHQKTPSFWEGVLVYILERFSGAGNYCAGVSLAGCCGAGS
jgi:hypothetical protein